MPRGSALDCEVLDAAMRVGCTTPSEAAREVGAKTHTAQFALERLAAAGALKKYLVMNRLAVYCVHSAEPREAVEALIRTYRVNEEMLLKRLRELVQNARGRRICVSKKSVYPVNTPLVNLVVIVYILSLLGGALRRGRFGRVYVCAEVEEARRRLESGALQPPDGVVREAEAYYVHKPRRRRYTAAVSVHLPKTWLNAMEELVAGGVYKSRSEIIRAAIRQMLKHV